MYSRMLSLQTLMCYNLSIDILSFHIPSSVLKVFKMSSLSIELNFAHEQLREIAANNNTEFKP